MLGAMGMECIGMEFTDSATPLECKSLACELPGMWGRVPE